MDNEQKERLEQELRFLEESLEADVISREEYLKGKERIEKKLKELEEKNQTEEVKGEKEEGFVEEKKDEIKEWLEEEKEEEVSEEKKPKVKIKKEKLSEEKIVGKEEVGIEEKKEIKIDEEKEKIEEETEERKKEKVKEEKLSEEKEEEVEKEGITNEEEVEEEKKPKRWLKWVCFLIIIVFLYFLFKGCSIEDKTPIAENSATKTIDIKPACISDEDCQKPGKIGFCINPNTTEAKCEFKEASKINLTIVNDKNCLSCETSRMTQVIKQLFPGAVEREVYHDSLEGLSLLKKFDINVLPTYIFDSNIVEVANFGRFKNALTKKGDKYLITPIASGANYYFKRDKIKNKLDLFVIEDVTSLRAEKNVKDVLELFGDKINFTKHLVSETEKELLQSNLGITSFPVFLVNNQLKFGGVRSPEAIKEKFCEFNELKECEEKLLENLK